MPENFRNQLIYTLMMIVLIVSLAFIFVTPATIAYEGIKTYYIRYDVKSSKNSIIDDNLLMTPAKNEFRAEKFSQIIISGVISADLKGTDVNFENKIKNDTLKSILIKNGLKSLKAMDYDTVISYEGVIITPVKILKTVYNEEQDIYSYEAMVEFSPIAFPDQWEKLNMKYKIKKVIYDFFELFK
jgi:hypothetical protein